MSNGGLREVLGYTLDEEQLVDKFVGRLNSLGIDIKSICFRDVTDAHEVISKLALELWDEFEKEFLQFVNENSIEIDEEDFNIEIDELKYGSFEIFYENCIVDVNEEVGWFIAGAKRKAFIRLVNNLDLEFKNRQESNMEIAHSFKELQELIGNDLTEEVLASYPNIVNEKVINYYSNQLDWAESILYPRAINSIDTVVFSTLYLVDLIDVNYLEEVMREQVDKSLGYVCSDGSIVTWVDETYD